MLSLRTMSIRRTYLYLGVLCLLIIISSFIMQYGFKLEPCSLCIIDRVIVIGMALLFFIACLHNPKRVWQLIYSLLAFIMALVGIAVTARHLWLLQLPPDKVPECGPGLSYLIDTMPLKEALTIVLKGSSECTKAIPYFLGLSLPLWTMIAFVLLAVASWAPWLLGRKK
jgi:disulfide bond formation protein DsbB